MARTYTHKKLNKGVVIPSFNCTLCLLKYIFFPWRGKQELEKSWKCSLEKESFPPRNIRWSETRVVVISLSSRYCIYLPPYDYTASIINFSKYIIYVKITNNFHFKTSESNNSLCSLQSKKCLKVLCLFVYLLWLVANNCVVLQTIVFRNC